MEKEIDSKLKALIVAYEQIWNENLNFLSLWLGLFLLHDTNEIKLD